MALQRRESHVMLKAARMFRHCVTAPAFERWAEAAAEAREAREQSAEAALHQSIGARPVDFQGPS